MRLCSISCVQICVYTAVFIWHLEPTNGKSLTDTIRLFTNITNGYNRYFRPIYNQSDAIQLYASFDIVSIPEFNEVNEKITIAGLLYLTWQDQVLRWDPNDHGGTETLVLPTTEVWVPELLHANPADDVERLVEEWHTVEVSFNGTVVYTPPSIYTTSCSVDVMFYPYDRQFCEILFKVWGYKASEVNLISKRETLLKTFYTDNGIWSLVRTRARTIKQGANGDTVISFRVFLDRKPGFVMVNNILPIVFVSFLNLMVFVMPNESGERISYCITVLLAIAVFLTLIGDNLPKTSQPLSLYSYYLLTILITSMCITIATVFSLKVYYRSNRNEVGSCWRRLAIVVGCKNKQARHSDKESHSKASRMSENGYYGNHHAPDKHADRPNRHKRTHDFYEDDTVYMHGLAYQQKRGHENYSGEITWQDVSKAVDKLFFIFFMMVIVTATIAFVLRISMGQDKEKTEPFFGNVA